RADPAILLDRGEAAEDRVLPDLDMTAKRGVVDEHDAVADYAIMGDMRGDHHEAIGTDPRLAAAARRAPVDRRVLADDAIRADHHRGRLALVAGVLRRPADRGERVELASGADGRVAAHHDMGVDDDIVLENHVALDDGIGPDAHTGADAGA